MRLSRPLLFFDLETTGLDVGSDRIVEIAFLKWFPDGHTEEFETRVNPGIPIPAHVSEVHHIYDEDVAQAPSFADIADQVLELMRGCDLAGYNCLRFDIPLLAEELLRAGRSFNVDDYHCIDVMNIFLARMPRTLAGAMAYYCHGEVEDAHSALGDSKATMAVLQGQLRMYHDLPSSVEKLAEYSHVRQTADLAGMLLYDAQGEAVYNFGKYKGQRVKDVHATNPGYYAWIQERDFPQYTKLTLRRVLGKENS